MKKELSLERWTESDIAKAAEIIHKAKQKRPEHVKILDKTIPWLSLILIVVGNFAISVVLIPFLMVLNQLPLYLLLALIGGSLGFFLELMIGHIEHLQEKHHHIIMGIFIFIIAMANVSLIAGLSNEMLKYLPIKNQPHNPWIIAFIYSAAFVGPYMLYRVIKKKEV